MSSRARIGILIALAVLAYLPALNVPFIVDDYHQIPLARDFASQGWTPLFQNHELRARATYMLLSAALDHTFGFSPFAFHLASIILHALCVLLVYSSGLWIEIGESVAFWAAAFFAIQEGHQEAIIWPAAGADLLVFLFGMAAWVCWVRWLQNESWKWYAAALASFLLAIASKEAAWVFAILMLLPLVMNRKLSPKTIAAVTPFLAIAGAYIIWTLLTRVSGAGYHDNRFSFSAPWFRILLNSWWKLLFVWGLLATAVLLWLWRRSDWRLATAAAIWMLVGLFPFCFLTYMLQIPSRLTYIASAGLAWLVGAAAVRLSDQRGKTALALFCAVTLAVNLEILWVKKIAQFRERAEPSNLFLRAGAESDGTVTIRCNPLPDFIAAAVLRSVSANAIFAPDAKEDQSCFTVEYRTRGGQLIRESRTIKPARHGAFY